MTTNILELETIVAPVSDGGRIAVNRMFCVGQNYADHAREMGSDPTREAPFFFMKAPSSLSFGPSVSYPPRTSDLQHEVELVAAIGRGGRDIPSSEALEHVCAYAVGLDMTRRDLQAEAKAMRRPWEMGKSFDGAAPIGLFVPSATVDLSNSGISLKVNGVVRQDAPLSTMTWSIAEIIAELSTYQTLQPGDLIFTGTPAGVAAVAPGDRLLAQITRLPDLEVTIAAQL